MKNETHEKAFLMTSMKLEAKNNTSDFYKTRSDESINSNQKIIFFSVHLKKLEDALIYDFTRLFRLTCKTCRRNALKT